MATNSSNTTLEMEVGWQPGPRTRGTADILWNCVTVIVLITWTSFYTPVGISKLRRISTTFTAILVPELSALVALRDIWFAYRLWHCFRDHVERAGWKYGWSLRKSFLVVKGGIVAGRGHANSETVEGEIIDTETFLRLAVMGCIRYEEFPTTKEINDKSKAGWFSKGATLIQLIWFSVNMICRDQYRCAFSVLESMTLDWVIFGVIATMLWWKCPQNINVPFTIPVHNPSRTAPSPKRDPNAPLGTLMDYIALYRDHHPLPSREVNGDEDGYWVTGGNTSSSLWVHAVVVVFMAFPILLHLAIQVSFFKAYQWHSGQHYTLWRLCFGFQIVAEVALFYVDPHMRMDSSADHIYYNYIRPLMLEEPYNHPLDKERVGRWLTVARGMGIYNSTDPEPWQRATQKTWHEIDLKLLVVTVFVILICQAGKLVIAIMAFESAPKGIYSVPDIPFLEALVHVGG